MNGFFTTFDLASSIERGREEAKRKDIDTFFVGPFDYRFLDKDSLGLYDGAIRSSGGKKWYPYH